MDIDVDGPYLSVRTYRQDGTSTACPVWAARDADRLYFRSFARTAKVRRLARDARVAVAPCDRNGTPRGSYREGRAVTLAGAEACRAHRALARRVGWLKPLSDVMYRPRLGARVVYAVDLTP